VVEGCVSFFCCCGDMLGGNCSGDLLAKVSVLGPMPCPRSRDLPVMVKHGRFLGFAPLVLAGSAFWQSRIRLRGFSGELAGDFL
jgi:hypothetical protein